MSRQKPLASRWVFHHTFKQKTAIAALLHGFYTNFTTSSMKAVCYIMTIVIAGLSAYPCNDGDICIDDQKVSYSILDANDHNHSSTELDLCTPFCTCSCCSAHIQVPTTLTYNLEHETSSSPINSCSSVFVDRLSYSIWQPPRLV